MFERFTDRARRTVVLAQEEARILNHNYIGTEHILLGLVHEGEGVAARSLDALGIKLGTVRREVEAIIGQGQEAPSGHIPFTPRAKKVLELSLREALQLGHTYIGPEHILLGLVREGEGVAAQVLVRLGASLNDVRQKVLELTAKAAESGPEAGLRVIREGDLAGRLDEILARLGAIESRLTRIDSRLARLEGRFGRGRPGDTGTAAEEPTGEGVSAELGGEVHGGEAPGTGTGRAEDTGDGETDDGDAAAVGGT